MNVMKLLYKGFVRRISGSGMAYADFDKEVPLVYEKTTLAVPDTYIMINSIGENDINFDVFFFDQPTNYVLQVGESVLYKKEGNAFAFEMVFSLVDNL